MKYLLGPFHAEYTPHVIFWLCSSWSHLPPQHVSFQSPVLGPGRRRIDAFGALRVGGGLTMPGRSGFALWGLPTHGLRSAEQLRARLLVFQELLVVEQQVSFAV